MKSNSTKNVLLIDGDPTTRDELLRHLESLGCKVVTADNGLEGLEICQNESFQLIVLDLSIPVINGVELIGRIRVFDRKTPIGVASSNALNADDRKFIEPLTSFIIRKSEGLAVPADHVKATFKAA